MKKNAEKPLPRLGKKSIIGLTFGNERRPAREAGEKIEGIGDVLSDGPKNRFLEVEYERDKAGKTLEKINEEFDPGSERKLVACLIHASRAVQQCIAANG